MESGRWMVARGMIFNLQKKTNNAFRKQKLWQHLVVTCGSMHPIQRFTYFKAQGATPPAWEAQRSGRAAKFRWSTNPSLAVPKRFVRLVGWTKSFRTKHGKDYGKVWNKRRVGHSHHGPKIFDSCCLGAWKISLEISSLHTILHVIPCHLLNQVSLWEVLPVPAPES